MPPNAGLQLQAAQGRMVRQGPANYAGRDTGMPQKTTAAAPAGMATPAAPARAARPQAAVGQPRPMPARNRTMNQVADVGFNRAAPPRGHINRGAPITGPGPVRGHKELPAQDMSRKRDYMGMAAANAAQGGVPGAAQQPAYSGMMGQQQANLQQALMQPKELGPMTPTQAYDPNAGKERADQSLMGPKTQSAPDWIADRFREFDQQQRDAQAGSEEAPATNTGSQASDSDEVYGTRRDGSGGTSANQEANKKTQESTADYIKRLADMRAASPFKGNGSASGPLGDMVSGVGDILSDLSGRMTEEDMRNINKYFGESTGAYRDIMKGAGSLMDPAQRDKWEDAARADLQSTVNQDKLANLRMNAAAQGRGGAMSSNADTGIYGSAANALATGERGLAQDRYGRDVAGMQAGMAGLGAGAGALQDLLGEGFTSNKETLAYLLTGLEKGADIGQLLADMLGGKWTA